MSLSLYFFNNFASSSLSKWRNLFCLSESVSHLMLSTYAFILKACKSLGLLLNWEITMTSNLEEISYETTPPSLITMSWYFLSDASPCNTILIGSYYAFYVVNDLFCLGLLFSFEISFSTTSFSFFLLFVFSEFFFISSSTYFVSFFYISFVGIYYFIYLSP